MIQVENVNYRYGENPYVLKGITCTFEAGNVYTIVGKSGSGKSTLLALLAGLDSLKEGDITIHGTSLSKMNRDEYRSKTIGVIFQSYNLLMNSSAIDNILLSMNISHTKVTHPHSYVLDLLAKVGIDEATANRNVIQMSGGEQQRVAIARALASNPEIIIADEPTGNLDEQTEEAILDIFKSLAREGKCVILVTHSKEVTDIADYIYRMKNGELATN